MKIIEVDHVSFAYPGTTTNSISNLNLTVSKSDWLAIIGQNGSGKSTLVKLLSGLQLPDSGSVIVNNQLVNEDNLSTIHQQVGVVFQNPGSQFVGSTVAEDVAFGLENRQVPSESMPTIIEQCLKAVDMWEYRQAAPDALSGGQQQRVAIASVLALQPQVLILDEATSMLDPLARQQVMTLLKKLQQQGLTIVMVTHELAEAEQAQRVLALDHGQVISNGLVHDVLSNQSLIQKLKLVQAPGQELINQLQQLGLPVPDHYLTTEEVVQWLKQRLNLTP